MDFIIKKGDRVLIKSREWYEENKDKNGKIIAGNGCFDSSLTCLLGRVVTCERIIAGGKYFSIGLYQEQLPSFCIEKVVSRPEEPGITPDRLYTSAPCHSFSSESLEKLYEQVQEGIAESYLSRMKGSVFSPEEIQNAILGHRFPYFRKDTPDLLDTLTLRTVLQPGMLTYKEGPRIRCVSALGLSVNNPFPLFSPFALKEEVDAPAEEIKLIKRNKFLKLDV